MTASQFILALFLFAFLVTGLFWILMLRFLQEKNRRPHGCFTLFPILSNLFSWLVFPILYEIAGQFSRAHAASDSEGGMFFWGLMAELSRLGFLSINILAGILALFGILIVRHRHQKAVLLAKIALITPCLSLVAYYLADYLL